MAEDCVRAFVEKYRQPLARVQACVYGDDVPVDESAQRSFELSLHDGVSASSEEHGHTTREFLGPVVRLHASVAVFSLARGRECETGKYGGCHDENADHAPPHGRGGCDDGHSGCGSDLRPLRRKVKHDPQRWRLLDMTLRYDAASFQAANSVG